MKILTTIKHQNFVMLEARKKKELSQQQLADLVGCKRCVISEIELLKDVSHVDNIDLILADIADVLDVHFDVIYPQDYLRALYGNKLPKRQRVIFDIPIQMLEAKQKTYLIESGDQTEKDATNNILREHLANILDELPPREREILEMRYGLLPGTYGMTRDEIAMKFNVTRERMKQLEERALYRLRNPRSRRQLREYLSP